jgi:hypothetical protein
LTKPRVFAREAGGLPAKRSACPAFSVEIAFRLAQPMRNPDKKEGAMEKLSIYIPRQYRSKKPLERLHKVARKRDRSMNYLAIQAIIEYLEREERRDLIERK